MRSSSTTTRPTAFDWSKIPTRAQADESARMKMRRAEYDRQQQARSEGRDAPVSAPTQMDYAFGSTLDSMGAGGAQALPVAAPATQPTGGAAPPEVQAAGSVALASLGSAEASLDPTRRLARSFLQGVSEGSILIPDAQLESDPQKLAEWAGIAVGAIGESYLAGGLALRGLALLARTTQSAKLAMNAAKAMELLALEGKAGASVSFANRAARAGFHTAVEGGLQSTAAAMGNQSWGDAAAHTALAGVGGAAFEGIGAAGSKWVAPGAKKLAGALGESKLGQKAKDAFVWEHRLAQLPGSASADSPLYTLADDWMGVETRRRASWELAAREVKERVLLPLQEATAGMGAKEARVAYEEAYGRLNSIVEAEWKLQKALAMPDARPEHLNALRGERDQLLNGASAPVQDAVERYYAMWDDFMDQIAAKGRLPAERRVEFMQTVEGAMLRWMERGQGFGEVLHKAVQRYEERAALEDFIDVAVATNGKLLSNLSPEARAALKAGKEVDGHKLLAPTIFHDFETKHIERALAEGITAPAEIAEFVKRSQSSRMGTMKKLIQDTEVPNYRESGGVALPSAVVDRLRGFVEKAEMLDTGLSPMRPVNWATNVWKGSVLFWNGARFFAKQLLTDPIMFARSVPGMFTAKTVMFGQEERILAANLRNIFAYYHTPMMGAQQKIGSVAGGVLGGSTAATVDALTGDKEVHWQDVIAGAALGGILGYGAGTRMVAGTLEETPELLSRIYKYEEMLRLGVHGSGYAGAEIGVHAGRGLGLLDPLAKRNPLDSVLSLLSGGIAGKPHGLVENFVGTMSLLQRERENWLRGSAYLYNLERGMQPRLAAKSAREIAVDYGRFTEFENKYMRGALLPFYSFTAQNTPNWLKAAAGKDVGGGKAGVAFAALGAVAAFDISAQVWNERFFPDIEGSLSPKERGQFHLILGNPFTREPILDKRGKPMVAGLDMPYEEALEILGLARPGALYSHLFGMGMHPDDSLVERRRRVEEATTLPLSKMKVLDGLTDNFFELLTPAITTPFEITSNRDWKFGNPIVPEEKFASGAHKDLWLKHVAKRTLAMFASLDRESSGGFNPLTSRFGLGLPIAGVDRDRALKRMLHDRLEVAANGSLPQDYERRQIRELIDKRDENAAWQPRDGELEELNSILRGAESIEKQNQLWRYYAQAASRRSDFRVAWDAMGMAERASFLEGLSKAEQTALLFYMNGGKKIWESKEPPAPWEKKQ